MGQCYRDLKVWQRAMDLATTIYEESAKFPKHELYGLTSQIRRASVSIPSNIAEGQGRRSPKEFCQFLRHSKGSLMEVETQTMIAVRLRYISRSSGEAILSSCAEVGKMLNGLIDSQLRSITKINCY